MKNQMDEHKTHFIFSWWSRYKIILFLFVLALVVPYKTTIVPKWKLRATDENGNPVPHARFRQGWDNYTYGITGMEFLEGDKNGYVILPERAFYAPLIYRIPRSTIAYLLLLAHGSVGNGASLNALSNNCSSKHLSYEEILTLPETIVIDC